MPQFTDPAYLRSRQYGTAANLTARIQLHERFSLNPYGWHRWIFDRLALPKRCRLLELGCGPATLWVENRDRIPSGWQITLSDLSAGMVQEARQNLTGVFHPFHFAIADAQHLPFASGHLDVVIANHMLYHVPDRPQVFREIRRVLKQGGRLYASTVGEGHMGELWTLIRRFDPSLDTGRGRLAFTLENGQEQLAPWFSRVTLHRYEDGLRVTEAEPLVAYVLSAVEMEGRQRAAFAHFVQQQLEEQGGRIQIRKETGLFEAY